MTLRLVFLFLAALLAHGCASVNTYDPPDGDKASLATIRGHDVRNGLFDWESYWIQMIDSKSVSYIFKDTASYRIPVTAAEHVFVVLGQFNRSFGGPCPCQGFVQLVAALEQGTAYRLNGRVNGIALEVWIEEAETGERVSAVARGGYGSSPRSETVFIPLVVN